MKRPLLLMCLALCMALLAACAAPGRAASHRRAITCTDRGRCPAAHRRSDAYAASPNPSTGQTN